MITTSNFAKSAKHPDAVAISQGVPRFYKGRRHMTLAPPPWLLKAKDPELFDREYRKLLDSLDAKQVAEDLGPNAIIVRCHRRLVAEWLEEKLGIVVRELEHERVESLPFNKQPSKWDAQSATPQLPMKF